MGKTNYSVARVVTYTKQSIEKAERHNERKNKVYSNKTPYISYWLFTRQNKPILWEYINSQLINALLCTLINQQ